MQAPFLYISLLLFFLLLSLFFSGSETAFLALNRLKLKYKAESGDSKAHAITQIVSNLDKFLSVILLGNNLTNIAAATLVTYIVTSYVPRDRIELATLLASAALTFVVLIFCELTPKLIAATHAEQVSRKILLPIRFSIWILYPFARLGSWIANRIVRLLGWGSSSSPFAHALNEEELRALISGSATEDIGERKIEMLHNVFEIGATQVREVMIPRTEVTAAEINDPMPKVLDIVNKTNHSRIPVYRGTFDNILGILYVKDVLKHLRDSENISLQIFLRPVHFVPASARLQVLLRQLQSMHQHMAVVVDEFGGVEGIVTLEDVLEEIVGEMRDERDTEAESVKSLGPDLYSVVGNLPVKDFNRLFSSKIPESREYATVVGFLQARMGRLLRKGERIRYQNLAFFIEKVEGFKIASIRIRVPATEGQINSHSLAHMP